MRLLYLFPSSVQLQPGGQAVLDWGGAAPFNSDRALVENPALAYPQVLPQALSAAECAQVVALGESTAHQRAGVNQRDDLASRDYRISDIAWIEPAPPAQWLFHRLGMLFLTVNRSYGLELSGFAEGLQYTCYGPGQYFHWHGDLGAGSTSLRKLSLTIQLSDPADYDGGELQFHGAADLPVARALGSATFFPSYLAHQVAPITRGLRRSLVAWAYGPAFR